MLTSLPCLAFFVCFIGASFWDTLYFIWLIMMTAPIQRIKWTRCICESTFKDVTRAFHWKPSCGTSRYSDDSQSAASSWASARVSPDRGFGSTRIPTVWNHEGFGCSPCSVSPGFWWRKNCQTNSLLSPGSDEGIAQECDRWLDKSLQKINWTWFPPQAELEALATEKPEIASTYLLGKSVQVGRWFTLKLNLKI